MAKKGGVQDVQTIQSPDDPYRTGFQNRVSNEYLNAVNGHLNPEQQFLRGQLGDFTQGQLGVAGQQGLTGIEGFYNPFNQEVIGGMQGDFAQQRAGAQNRAADVATRAGAFGGDRSAILEAQLTNDVNRNEANTIGQFRNQGFQNAAGQLMAQRGLASQNAQFGLGQMGAFGQQQVNNRLGLLGLMPQGFSPDQTITQQQQGQQGVGNIISGAAGGALAGMPLGPWGALAGGGLGLLGGLFG